MTAPVVHNPQSTLDEQEDFGLCDLVVDARVKKQEVICGKPGVDEILVRNPFGLFAVVICREHKEQHRKFYLQLKNRQHRHRRTSES